MAKNEIKKFTFEVEIKDAEGNTKTVQKVTESVDDYRTALAQAQEQADKAPLNSKEWKEATKRTKELSNATEQAEQASMSFTEKLEAIPGPIGQVVQGVKGAGQALKVLAANPIGAVITAVTFALTALFKAFKSTKEGAETLDRVTAAFSAGLDVLRDILVVVAQKLIDTFKNPKQALIDFGNALKKNIINRVQGMLELLPAIGKAISLAFKGQFKEAGKVAANAVGKVTLGVENVVEKTGDFIEKTKDVVKEIREESTAAAELTGRLQKIDDAQRELNVRRAEQNALIAEAKRAITDESLSYEERMEAAKTAFAAEQQLLNEELSLNQQRLDTLKALAAQSDSSKETLEEIAQLEITIAQQREQSANKQKELADTTKSLQEQEKARLQSVADFRESLEASALDNAKKREEKELEALKQANIRKLDELKVSGDEREAILLQIEEDYQTKKAAIDKKYADEEIARQQELLDKKMENLDMASLEDVNKAKELFNEKLELELSNTELTEEERTEIKKKYAAIQEQIDRDTANAQIDASIAALEALATIGGEESGLAKASGIAVALINAYRSISETLAAKSILPEPFGSIQKGISAAAIGVNAFKQVRAIAGINTDGPKSQAAAVKGKVQRLAEGGIVRGQGTSTSDSIPTMLSDGESVINARSTSLFGGLLSTINQLGGGRSFDSRDLLSPTNQSNSETPVIKTYVVSTDVTNQQELDRQQKTRSLV